MKKVLTIAGSDSSGGAGIQADIKTITVHGLYAMSAVTALTAQNTTGVYGVEAVPPAFLKKQLDSIYTDIVPDAVKVGMLADEALVQVVAESLKAYGTKNLVVDTVMVSTSGSKLISSAAISLMQELLLPLATVITPNIPEAEVLSGISIHTRQDMQEAAQRIYAQLGSETAVLVKGGHSKDMADDLLYWRNEAGQMQCRWFEAQHIDNPNTHGTGCTLSSAIAVNLANGSTLAESIQNAKDYVTGAIRAGLNLGRGNGPLDHMYMQRAAERQHDADGGNNGQLYI